MSFDLVETDTVKRFTVAGGYATLLLLNDRDAALFIIDVEPSVRRFGQGTKLLEQVTAWADEAGRVLTLAVIPQADEPGVPELERWYSKHGWEPVPGSERQMKREPRDG